MPREGQREASTAVGAGRPAEPRGKRGRRVLVELERPRVACYWSWAGTVGPFQKATRESGTREAGLKSSPLV